MKVKINQKDALIFIMMSLFFVGQLAQGTMRTLVYLVMIAFSLLYAMYYKHLVWIVLFFALTFQKAVQGITAGTLLQIVTYYDEIVEVFIAIFLAIVLAQRRSKLSRDEQLILFTYMVYVVFLIVSSVFNQYMPINLVILDLFVCAKFMIFYRGGAELSRQRVFSRDKIFNVLNAPCRAASVILLLLTLHDLIMKPFFKKSDFRYFTKSIRLCFNHPTYYAAVCLMCMVVLMYNMKFEKKNFKYILFLSVCTFFTLRSKAIAIVAFTLIVYFAFIKYRIKNKGIILGASVIGVIYLGYDQFIKYYTVQKTVPIRLKLITDGFNLAKQHFPFGAGLATFGTTVAYDNNSPFYFKLGYMTGFYQGQPVGDGFWGGILAEAGIFGTIALAICIVFMLIDSIKRLRQDKYAGWCMLTIVSYAIIASTAETAFYNPATALLFLVYGIASDRTSDNIVRDNDTGQFYIESDDVASESEVEVNTQ